MGLAEAEDSETVGVVIVVVSDVKVGVDSDRVRDQEGSAVVLEAVRVASVQAEATEAIPVVRVAADEALKEDPAILDRRVAAQVTDRVAREGAGRMTDLDHLSAVSKHKHKGFISVFI